MNSLEVPDLRKLGLALLIIVGFVLYVCADEGPQNQTVNNAIDAAKHNAGLVPLKVNVQERLDRPGAFGFYNALDQTGRKVIIQSRDPLKTDEKYTLRGSLVAPPKGVTPSKDLYFLVDEVSSPSPLPWILGIAAGAGVVAVAYFGLKRYRGKLFRKIERMLPDATPSVEDTYKDPTIVKPVAPIIGDVQAQRPSLVVRKIPEGQRQNPTSFDLSYNDEDIQVDEKSKERFSRFTFGRDGASNTYHLQPDFISREEHFMVLAYKSGKY